MKTYQQQVKDYYNKGYIAENIESWVFRTYGIVFKSEFGMDGSNHEKLLDFGCGQGSALQFFKHKGFDVYGVDISEDAISGCQAKMPDIHDHFAVINPEPSDQDNFFGGDFDIVIGIQSIYHLSNTALRSRLLSIYDQMKPGALIYLTMMGDKCYYYNHSQDYEDGLRLVNFKNDRIDISNYYVNFTYSEEDLLDKLSMFKRIHVGYYDQFIREDEGSYFHYTFVGQKV